MIGYFLALIPAYLFLYIPITQLLYGPSTTSSQDRVPFNISFIAPDEPAPSECEDWRGSVHIISREPLVMYLENWLGMEEAAHLEKVSTPLYTPSTTLTSNNISTDPTIRLSLVATPPRTHTVRCIEARARALQGWETGLMIERLKMQRYTEKGHYVHHFDWAGLTHGGRGGTDRLSSFLAWVECTGENPGERCRGGGTEFPRLKMGRGQRKELCTRGWIECPELEDSRTNDRRENGPDDGKNQNARSDDIEVQSGLEGVTFRPIAGNAIFWENLRKDGTGYEETWHAGLPVESGTKVGLNIWTWYQF